MNTYTPHTLIFNVFSEAQLETRGAKNDPRREILRQTPTAGTGSSILNSNDVQITLSTANRITHKHLSAGPGVESGPTLDGARYFRNKEEMVPTTLEHCWSYCCFKRNPEGSQWLLSVKNTCCSWRRPEFGFQHPWQEAHSCLYVTLAPSDLMPPSGLHG